MNPVLEVKQLNAYYGAAQVLFDVNINLQAGQAKVLLGSNGAGKSSCLKAMIGLVHRQASVLQIQGVHTLTLSVEDIANLGVGYVPENRRIFTRLKVLENLQMAARLGAEPQLNWTVDTVLDALPHLKKLLKRYGDAISGGEQRMLAVARALMRSPSLLLLDEPCEGVAPKVADAIETALHCAMQRGVAVLLSESHQGFSQRLGARPVYLHAGTVRPSESECLETVK